MDLVQDSVWRLFDAFPASDSMQSSQVLGVRSSAYSSPVKLSSWAKDWPGDRTVICVSMNKIGLV